jgi:hypothetical protein
MSGNRDFVVHTGEAGARAFHSAMQESFEDLMIAGESAYGVSRRIVEPEIKRVDPSNIVRGKGILEQIENANVQTYQPVTEDSIAEFLAQMSGSKEKRRKIARRTNISGRTGLILDKNDR